MNPSPSAGGARRGARGTSVTVSAPQELLLMDGEGDDNDVVLPPQSKVFQDEQDSVYRRECHFL